MEEKISKILKASFSALFVLFLLFGFLKAVVFPNDISVYEQRTLNKLPMFKVSGYLDGSFQTDTDSALGDQISFSSYYKKLYNEFMAFVDGFYEPLRNNSPDRYVCCRGDLFFNGHMVDAFSPIEEVRDELNVSIEKLADFQSQLPDVNFYLYYVNNDKDMNFTTGENSGVYDYLRDNLPFGSKNFDCFAPDGFDEYQDCFYFSDHHWNHMGSYKAYVQLSHMLGFAADTLKPTELVEVPGIFHGSRTMRTGAQNYYDKMQAYIFDFPPMEVHVPDDSLTRYGDLEILLERKPSEVSYVSVYGDNMGYMQLSTGIEDREDILVVGDSYDNALLKLIASHYNRTHSIDLRYYSYFRDEAFILSDYVRDNDISTVLFVGSRINFLELAKLEQ